MYLLKVPLLLLVALQFIGLPCSTAEKVIFDLHSDTAQKWLEITCLYNDDYNDFWVYGYPVTLSGEDDKYPSVKGFWTAGLAQRCEMHYYGGPQMPMAKSLTIELYLRGNPQVLVSSKLDEWEGEYTDEVGMVSEKDGEGWFATTIDLTGRARAFNFTLISPGDDDILLVDKITFDLGDEATTPTEPPAPTTVTPIDPNNTVVLDTDNDYWILWEENCHYIDDYSYMWAYGFPAYHLKEESPETVGFWNPGRAKNCTLRFKGSPSIVPYTPSSIEIRAYVDGDYKIKVTIQSNHDDLCKYGDFGCWEVGFVTETNPINGWIEVAMPQIAIIPSNYTINIELIPSEGGIVLLDRVVLRQQETPATTTTTRPTGNPTGSTTPGGGQTTPDSGAESAKLQWPLMALLLVITGFYPLINK